MPSQITFHGKYVNISDGDVTFILHMLLESLARTKSDDWSTRARSRWERRLSGFGFGLYELELEKLVTNPQEKERMLQIIEGTRQIIAGYGPWLKKEWLNSLRHSAVIYTEDQESSWYLEKLNEIENLVKS
jgi:hypothetical protein